MKLGLVFDLLFALLVFYFLAQSGKFSISTSITTAVIVFVLGCIALAFFHISKS